MVKKLILFALAFAFIAFVSAQSIPNIDIGNGTIVTAGGSGTINNTNICYLNNTQSFTGLQTFLADINIDNAISTNYLFGNFIINSAGASDVVWNIHNSFNNGADGVTANFTVVNGKLRESGVGVCLTNGTGCANNISLSQINFPDGSIQTSACAFGDLPNLRNCTVVSIKNMTTSNGFQRIGIYTAPAGRRGYIAGYTIVSRNRTLGSGSVSKLEIQNASGSFFRLNVNISFSLAQTATTSKSDIILDSGESFTFVTPNNATLIYVKIIEFDNTTNVFSKKCYNPTSSGCTLYTVPTGKQAQLLSIGLRTVMEGTAGLNLNYVQDDSSGGNTNLRWYAQQSGDSIDNTTMIHWTNAPTANTLTTQSLNWAMNQGDSIVCESNNNNGSMCWINVQEFP